MNEFLCMGRGTDIKLGPGVEEAGGLRVIAEERNESRRIDRQLAGRAGRQGDPGSSQFFMSYEDDLIVRSAKTPPVAPEPGELPAHEVTLMDVRQLRCERVQAARRAAVMQDDHRMEGLKKNL